MIRLSVKSGLWSEPCGCRKRLHGSLYFTGETGSGKAKTLSAANKMRIIFLVPSVNRCGGVRVICDLAARLSARGHDAEVWSLDGPPDWFGRPIKHRGFINTDQLGDSLHAIRPKAVAATFWSTATWIPHHLFPGDWGGYVCQDLDGLVYSGRPDEGEATYRLPLTLLTLGDWMTAQLRQRGLSPVQIGMGIDLEAFRPLPIIRDRNRVFTTHRPSAGPNDLKGTGLLHETLAAARRLNPRLSCVTYGETPPRLNKFIPTVHVAGPSDLKLKELYSQAGCYLVTSRHEGFCLPAAEAMACGCPVISTRADGNLEFCRDNETALLADFGDAEGLAKRIVQIQSDPDLADRIGEAGRAYIQRYQWDGVIDRLEAAIAGRTLPPLAQQSAKPEPQTGPSQHDLLWERVKAVWQGPWAEEVPTETV